MTPIIILQLIRIFFNDYVHFRCLNKFVVKLGKKIK